MKIEVRVHPIATTAHECARAELHLSGQSNPYVLDLDVTTLLRHSLQIDEQAFDFLFVASIIYAIDKAVPRTVDGDAEDRWTRELGVSIPVATPARWRRVAKEFSACVSFLTGDVWAIRFEPRAREVVQIRPRRRSVRRQPLFGAVASLFSGGLDSYIGAIDWLEEQRDDSLCLVSHYDGHVGGPKSDQRRTFEVLKNHYGHRINSIQMRVGIKPAGPETTFRSRSLLFIAIGYCVATKLGANVPVIIPENGPISLNYPLNPSRRGSCSTRTTHPYFLSSLHSILETLGFERRLINPYEFSTKGEMVANCKNKGVLRDGALETVSCAKSGHVVHWDNRTARACGRCIPCLFRRAALHVGGLDIEPYGIDVCSSTRKEGGDDDLLALLSFLRRDLTPADVSRTLACNGSLPANRLAQYADVVKRMRVEIRDWIETKGQHLLKRAAEIS
jgi:7-cyano-7-deazaguanine synthase in queuosine biosynthesis